MASLGSMAAIFLIHGRTEPADVLAQVRLLRTNAVELQRGFAPEEILGTLARVEMAKAARVAAFRERVGLGLKES